MKNPRVLAMILAGGKGSRMDVLTRERPKPILPFGGTHRLIDVPLSNLRHSGIDDVLMCVQYHAVALERAVGGGRPWDLDRTRGGLLVVGPEEGRGAERSGFSTGNADLLRRYRHEIRRAAPDVVLVLSADHVYTADYRDLLATHVESGADCTMLTYDLSKKEAGHHTVVELDGEHRPGARVASLAHKPSTPATSLVCTEVIAYDAEVLMKELGVLHADADEPEEGDTGLGDFGETLLPHLVEHGTVVVHPHEGYWRDAGRPDSYLRAHRDLLAGEVDLFTRPERPLLGATTNRPGALVRPGAEILDSMISPGCEIRGRVVRSVLGPGVVVEAGAEVVDSVLFEDVTVGAGAFVGTAIVDHRVEFARNSRLGVETGTRLPTDDAISLVGRESAVAPRVEVGAGARLEPGTRA
ncbi:sugar phosphate nucleotidyltransferase [Mobilicoccus sp.]|uniref:glucose-1-phosphate adenylyltransferase family protein n=1 Tax=Mobilicoccus sp. TaxID=2034349 RepID=UPI0028AB71C8|nr:sugar phosphate nucleotidyltransferase [Mobilicoccus sp.]